MLKQRSNCVDERVYRHDDMMFLEAQALIRGRGVRGDWRNDGVSGGRTIMSGMQRTDVEYGK